MLTIQQKVQILRRAGVVVPAQPQMAGQIDETGFARTSLHPRTWEEQINALFALHAIERATRSLQQGSSSDGTSAVIANAGPVLRS